MPHIPVEGPRGADPKRVALVALALGVSFACFFVLRPLAAPIAWASILAYVSWPVYRLVRRPFGRFRNAAALSMTGLLICVVILPVLWLLSMVATEMLSTYRALAVYLGAKPVVLPDLLRGIPWLGDQLQQQAERLSGEPGALGAQDPAWIQSWMSEIAIGTGPRRDPR